MAYSKLHSSLVHSSLWTEADHVRLLFITLLAMCDKDGYVAGSRPGLERAACIDWDTATERDPWKVLMEPDMYSSDRMRAPENEGRRIEEVPGGFRLLNFEYYRGLRNEDDRREQNRKAQEKYRQNHNKPPSAKVSQGKPASAKVSPGKPRKAHTDTDTDTEAEKITSNDVVELEANSTVPLGKNSPPEVGAAVAAEEAPGKRTEAEEVFDAYRSILGHGKMPLDESRRRAIRKALKTYPVETLCRVPLGVLKSPYHMGQNENGRKYDSVGLIYRDADRIDYFLGLVDGDQKAPPAPHPIDLCDRCNEDGLVEIEKDGKIRNLFCSHQPIVVIPEPNENGHRAVN